MKEKYNKYSSAQQSKSAKIRYIGSILLLCKDPDCPVLEKFNYLYIVKELLFEFLERHWSEIYDFETKKRCLLDLEAIMEKYSSCVRDTIEMFNQDIDNYKIVTDLNDAECEKLFTEKIIPNSKKKPK